MRVMDASLISLPKVFPLFFVLLVTVSLSYSYGNLDVACLESEKHALLSFKKSLKDPSSRLSSWDVEADCCKWAGVVCNNLTSHVRELHLQNPNESYVKQKLGGEVNPSLLDLKHLSYLDLSQNDFGGIPIPSFLGSLASLRYLNLSDSGFAGTVPHHLGNLSSLRSLGLKGPSPYGDLRLNVENLDWLSSLSTLERLDLSQVKLSKTPNWLQVINMLPSLVELRLSYCELDHMPPLEKVNFTSLAVLDLSWNEFTDLMPRWIFRLSSLVSLNLAASYFEGSLPDSFWNLTSLRMFDVSINHLNSTLPKSLWSVNDLISLNLRDNGFVGPIPSGLQNMTSLRELDLSENDFNSSIPNWLYNFKYLELLDLHSTWLHGTLSSSIANLTSLVTLDVSFKNLRGRVPREMGNLCNLRVLLMSENKIEGNISELFESLSGCSTYSLVSLSCDECGLSGHLTDQLEQFRTLQYLSLDDNSLSGPIPVSFGRCSSLEVVSLVRNKLTGSLPENFGHLSNLKQINLHGSLLEGVVSEVHFVNLTSLKELYASGNHLVLKVSPNWIPPFQLEALELRSWHLGPRFPMWLRSQKGFWDMDLSGTGISDSVPQWFWNLSSSFMYLNLSHNQIQGKIPNIPKLDVVFSMIYLGSNQFSGPLPRLSSNVTELDLSNNSFSGEISHFLCDRNDEPNQLEFLHLGENQLFGEIPNCWENWPNLKFIKLENNHFSGNIPSSLGFLSTLESLHLRNNSLSGEVPSTLENCTQLVTVDLGLNLIVGSFPTWLGRSLSNLKFLSLRSNYLHGQIPSELCHLSSLQILDLANNNFSGPIPHCLKNLTAMVVKQDLGGRISYSLHAKNFLEKFVVTNQKFLENLFVVTKGREVQYYNTILALATSMDLSDNNISGEIPEEITSLLGLRSLNLSGNHLTGVIPKDIGNMGLLESLDFSVNLLSGIIPQSISGLNFLSRLNLSYNNLSGRIPTGNQLQTLDDPPSSYLGNSELCGVPLPRNCLGDEKSQPPTTTGHREEHKGVDSEFFWFYMAIMSGYATGLWGVLGVLVLKKTWRYAFFQFVEIVNDKVILASVLEVTRLKNYINHFGG